MDDNDNNLPPSESLPPQLPEQPLLEGGAAEESFEDDQEEIFLDRNTSGLSSGPGKVIAFGIIMLVVVGFVLYTLFSNKPQAVNPAPVGAVGGVTDVASAPAVAPPPPAAPLVTSPPPAPPPPPPPPQVTAPPAPVTTPPPPPPPPLPPKTTTAAAPPPPPGVKPLGVMGGANDKSQQQRLRSNMLVINGGPAPAASTETKAADAAVNEGDPNKTFTANTLKASATEKAAPTRLTNLNYTIAQGKIIDAVMESAVNTDLPGTLRAIVSRDIFAESGRQVMIPKGSRLIGTYSTSVARGQARVLIIWTRLIRPDGIDIAIGSAATDALGRGGVPGIVDNKYSEIFSAAILTSALGIGVAVATDAMSNRDSTTTTNVNGTTTTGSSAAAASAGTVATIGNISKDIVNTMLDLRPTITIDQGTKINVFVNKDLIFPSSVLNTQFVE